MDDKPTSPQDALAQIAAKYIGTEEQTDAPLVDSFRESTGSPAVGQAWCMDFVQFCLKEVALTYGWKASILVSQGVLAVWQAYPVWKRALLPSRGRLVIWQKVGSWEGHCGIVQSAPDKDSFLTVEGNTTPGKDIERTGDGVYEKLRYVAAKLNSLKGQLRLLGFIDPYR